MFPFEKFILYLASIIYIHKTHKTILNNSIKLSIINKFTELIMYILERCIIFQNLITIKTGLKRAKKFLIHRKNVYFNRFYYKITKFSLHVHNFQLLVIGNFVLNYFFDNWIRWVFDRGFFVENMVILGILL